MTAPQAGTPTLPNPGEVKAPGTQPPPPTGPSPSDTPGNVKPPSGSGLNPPAPPPIGGTPAPIQRVQPPLGWKGGGQVNPQDIQTLDWWSDLVKAIVDAIKSAQTL